jgi:anaerobic selenocysteine-containing dehydrogenase
MAIPALAALAPLIGKAAKVAGTGLTGGKFLDAAIPGKSEQALRQVGKEARDRLSKGQYGMSQAEQEQEIQSRMGDVARYGQQGGMNPYQTSRGFGSMADSVQAARQAAVLAALTGQRGVAGQQVAKESRQMGREQKAQDIQDVQKLTADTQKRTEAIVGGIPEKTKAKGLISYGLEGGATLAQKKPKSDKAVMKGIASGMTETV